jgi:hypothetical protein
MSEADELRKMPIAAGTPLKAMILLAANGGFGNADCATLPLTAVNLETGWLNYPRAKTGIGRRFPLWPETVDARKEALARRPEPKKDEHAGLFFITKYGNSWHKEAEDNPISKEMRKLLDSLGINGCRNFYALRHTFETVGSAESARPKPGAKPEPKGGLASEDTIGEPGSPVSFVTTDTDKAILTTLERAGGQALLYHQSARESCRKDRPKEVITVGQTVLGERIPILKNHGLVAPPLRRDGKPAQRKGVGITPAGHALLLKSHRLSDS